MPNYRIPTPENVLRLMWEKAKDFLQRAFTVIFIGTVVIWILEHFDFRLNLVDDPGLSMLAIVADLITPIFKPLGFADWRISTALLSGFLAKESVVSTLSVLYGSTEALFQAHSLADVFALLVFCLLYTPCIAAVAAFKQEQGHGGAIKMVLFQCLTAWIVAFVIRKILLVLI